MRRTGLFALILAALFCAPDALAQTQRQDVIATDENSVGVANRQYRGQITDISIGNGSATLSVSRELGLSGRGTYTDMFPLNEYAGYYNTTVNGGPQSIELFNRRIDFDTQGNTEHGRIVEIPNGVAFYAKDGSIYRFEEFTNSTGPIYEAYVGLLTSVTYPDGRTTRITWQTAMHGELVGQDACCMEWQYTAYARIASINNNSGYQLKFLYQSNDDSNTGLLSGQWNAVASIKALNNTIESVNPTATTANTTQTWPNVSYSYPSGGTSSSNFTFTATNSSGAVNSSQVQNVSGNVTITLAGPATGSVTINTTGSVGGVSSVTANGVTTSYSVPDGFNGYRYRATSPSGSQITYTTNTDRDRILSVVTAAGTTSYQYDTQKRLTRITMPEGNYVAYTYDSRGNVTEVRRVAKSGSGLPDMVTSAGFAASCTNDINCDRAQWTRDERGNQTDFAYHATTGQLLSVTLPAAATGTDRPQTRYSYTSLTAYYRDASGNLGPSDTPMSLLTQISECVNAISCAGGANERVTAIGYGPTNVPTNLLPLSVTLRSGDNAVSSTSTTTYDNLGAVLIIDGPLPGAADTTRFRYDSAGRLIGTIGPDPDGSGGNPHPAERINYNSSGLPISAESGTVSGQLDIDWANFSPSRRVEQDYDLNLRPTVSRLMSGSTTYSLTQTGYDEDGRVKCVAQRMNPAEFASLPADACALDTEGTGANAFGPDRIIRTYYDAAGRVTQVRSAYGVSGQETNDATTTYTANSQVETLTDAEGNRTTYEYDGHDRLRNLRYPSPTTDGVSAPTSGTGADYQQLTYATATVGGSTVSTPLVAGVQLRDASSIGFTYDNLGRLTIKVVPERSGLSSTHTRDVYYAYDLLGRLTEARFDSLSGPGVSNGYNALGRLTYTSTTMDGTTRTLSYQYDAAGRRTRITHPDSAYFVYEYDTLGRLTGIDENGSSDIQTQSYHATGEVYLDGRTGSVRGWLYDPVGRPYYQINDMPSSAGTSWTMTRNPADQVISNVRSNDAYAWGGHHQVNRSYVADGLNRYTAVGGASYSYDANGNLTGDGTRTWTYDRENRLVGASGGVELGYDPLGRLAWSTGSPNLTRFVWDDWSLVAEYSSSGTVAERYVHGDGIDNPIFWYHGSAVGISNRRQFLTDPLGSIVAITDGYGVRTNVNSYDEYGVPASGNVGRFQYTGQIWLPELGMQYSRNRIYWPTLGRFMQTDPIGYGDGTNIYAYVGNDPVNFTDPSGLQSNCDDVRLIGFQGSTPVFRCSSGSSSQTRNLLAVFANNAWVGPTQADDRDRLTREQEQLLQREALRRLRARPQAELCPGNGSVFGTIADYAQSFGDFADGVAIGAAGLGLITAPTGVGGAFFGGTALVAGVVGRIASGVAALANFADGNNRGAAADAAGIVGGRIAGKFVGRVATNAYARNRMFRDLNAGQERRVRFYGDTTAAAASRVASRAICG